MSGELARESALSPRRDRYERRRVYRAVHLALIGCCLAEAMDGIIERGGVDAWLERSDEVKAEWERDIYAIPSEFIAKMDPMALAQNVGVHLLGTVPLRARPSR